MAWEDDLLPAKLNGVTFLYSEVKGNGGRRTVLYEYPGGGAEIGAGAPHVEDMGRKARTYNVRAFLIGPNYHVTRNDLIDVLDGGGELDFQHPYRGPMKVKLLGEFDWTESDQRGGSVEFSFTLVEAGLEFPILAIATAAKVTKLAAVAADVVAKKTKFSLLNAISDVVQSVTNGFGKATSAIRKTNGKIGAGLSLVDDITFALQSFDEQLTALRNQPQNLMNKFIALKSSLMGLIKDFKPPDIEVDVIGFQPSLKDMVIEALLVLDAVEQVAEAIPTPTEQFIIEAEGLAAVDLADKAGSVIYAADAAASLELASADDALQMQEALLNSFDNVLATDALDPEILNAMTALKAATVEHFTKQQENLPNLASYPVQQTMPALAIAYELYGDASRDEEIIQRNRIRHPGFVPGGTALKVLSND